jgi:hypothetical protein
MRTVSDFVIDRLIEWDPQRFYGYPGDGIGGFDRREPMMLFSTAVTTARRAARLYARE